jgi:hypothetical protein
MTASRSANHTTHRSRQLQLAGQRLAVEYRRAGVAESTGS